MCHRQPFNKYSINKILRRHFLHLLSETDSQYPIDTQSLKRYKFLPEAGQPGRRIQRGEVFPWQRFEYNNRGRQRLGGRPLQQLPDNSLMAAVNAIKSTDGRHATSMSGAQIVQASYQFHESGEQLCQSNPEVYRNTGP